MTEMYLEVYYSSVMVLAQSHLKQIFGAHALILLTEWDMYLELDFEKVYETMSRPAHIFDGRNLLDHDKLREIGFLVEGVGKGSPPSDE